MIRDDYDVQKFFPDTDDYPDTHRGKWITVLSRTSFESAMSAAEFTASRGFRARILGTRVDIVYETP